MSMTIEGTVTKVLDEVSGEGKNGTWRKQEFILETGGNYPKQVCLVMWGDNIDKFGIFGGAEITAHIDLASREHNSRWYTDVKVWKIGGDTEQAAPPVAPKPTKDADGLPF